MKKKIDPHEKVSWDDYIISSTSYYLRDGHYIDCFWGPQEYDGSNPHALKLRTKYLIDVLVEEYEIKKSVATLVIHDYAERTRLEEKELNVFLEGKKDLDEQIDLIANKIKSNINFSIGGWDAYRLLKKVIKLSYYDNNMIRFYDYNKDSEITSDKIRCERVLSVISAYTGKEISNLKRIPFFIVDDEISKDKLTQLYDLLDNGFSDRKKKDCFFSNLGNNSPSCTNRFLCAALFRYRIALKNVTNIFEYIDTSNNFVNDLPKNLYEHHINEIEKSIIFLLGDNFDKTFTEEELKEKYGYPKMSNEELHKLEWEIR
ncbi:MAG: hypothetical protein J6K31_05465 [Parabacteroides sp.]|nr:hypothetical protein [Parabacteroides sp.]